MLLGLASLVLGIVASSVTSTIAAARAAGAAAGRAFAAGFGRVRTGMASVMSALTARFPRLGAAISAVNARMTRFGARMRALSPTMTSFGRGLAAHTRSMFRMTRAVSSVAGAFQGSNGLWYVMRNGNRVLLTQRHTVTQTYTAWGRLMNRMQGVGERISNNLPLLGALTAGIVVLAPAIGAALGAAITAAVGIGVMAAGIAIAAKQSDRVQAAFADAFKPIGRELSEVALTAFEGPLIESATRFKQAWREVGPVVKSALAKSAEFVKPLSEGLAQMFENMLGGGGFSKLIAAAGPVISQVSAGLSRLGDAFDNFFESIADAGPGLVKGMIVIFAALTAGIVALGNTIEFLSKAFDRGTNFAQRYAEVFAKMLGWLPGVGDLWQNAADTLGAFNHEAGTTSAIMPIAGVAASNMGGQFNGAAAAAERARKALSDLTEKITGLINAQLGADQAALAFRRSLDAVTASVRENGTSIDINTVKGQNNIDMVQQSVSLALQKHAADIKLAGGEKATAQAIAQANAALQANIAQLEATMRAAGFTQAQIDALLGKYRALANTPNITKTVTMNVTTVYREIGSPSYNRVPGQQVAFAKGTKDAPKGVALVGEEGPELVTFGGGEQVWTARETASLLASSRSLAKDSAYDMASLGKPEAPAPKEATQTLVKVFIGNEEFKGYVTEVTNKRADERDAKLARRLNGW